MAEYENITEINENFDTIKTLLNSIRAQGILNTSDVDKLLTGINSKLEKINTDEDIDLIKLFLSELKQNLDERHNVLISKFGAIEALFSNLLKNSTELPKSSDIKELFDIVATNLSVFSREVVSQKDALTDITLRLDAMRSDDSQKKDIIKSIALLKPDLERLNNGFDSIVISLNDNFKTIIKTITSIDKSDSFDKFGDNLSNIEMSTNTVLSALQVIDKKTERVEDLLKETASKEDIVSTNQKIFDLTAHQHELTAAVTDLSDRYVRIDNLADKIDASVNIIATLKSNLDDASDKNLQQLVEKLNSLQADIQQGLTESKFEQFKLSIQNVVAEILQVSNATFKESTISNEELRKLADLLSSLDIAVNFKDLFASYGKTEAELKQYISESEQRISTLGDANITRVLNDISSNADSLGSKINQTQTEISILFEKNFSSIFENIANLKQAISQIDENSISANNAIFSSITDRLTLFEEGLRSSLEAQEKTVNFSSSQIIEQVENIKNISSVLDYKLDSSVVEIGNVKREFSTLQAAVENVLALDFVTTVKDLRVDLYASKQELVNTIENSESDLAEKFTSDLYGKYELLISKLDSVEDEMKKSQIASLVELKAILENISGSIIDVISYVSENKKDSYENFDIKLDSISELVKDNNMNYIEGVRDVVDVIRVQVESNLKNIETALISDVDSIKNVISDNSEDIKKDIKYSYSKLLEIQDSYSEIKELINLSNSSSTNNFEAITNSALDVKSEFESKLSGLKKSILDKIAEIKQEFTIENTDKTAEFKFTVESLNTKSMQSISELVADLRLNIEGLFNDNNDKRSEIVKILTDDFKSLNELIKSLNDNSELNLQNKFDSILEGFNSIKEILDKVDENVDGDMTRQLSLIESNFESLVSQITILFEKSDRDLSDKINEEFSSISNMINTIVTEKLDSYKIKIEDTFDNLEKKASAQTEYLQERIANLNSVLKGMWDEQSESNLKQFELIAESLKDIINSNIEASNADYADLKSKVCDFAKQVEDNNKILVQDLKAQFDDVSKYVDTVIESYAQDSNAKQEELVASVNNIDNNIEFKSNGILAALDAVSKNIELQGQIIQASKDSLADSLIKEFDSTNKNIEKETDAILNEVVEQFEILKNTQADDIIKITSSIEEIINTQFYNNIEDLKSYLDIKTDTSLLVSKLDVLNVEISNSIGNVISDMNKLLDTGAFTSSMSDFKLANEVLVNSAIDRINDKVEAFFNENYSIIAEALTDNERSFEERLSIFNGKLAETIVDKYEEMKLLSNEQNTAFCSVKDSINSALEEFKSVHCVIEEKIDALKDIINSASASSSIEIRQLRESFDNLRSQISNKSFDEAFQASINKQIAGLEDLINEQLKYVEDINEMCATSLPDVTELNTLVKHSILESVKEFSDKLDNQDIEGVIERELKQVKSDIITQLLNVFNQVSFVAEQEEILDFIQEKHDDLITVLSHIVTTSNEINQVKDSVSQLNDKINAIISSDGDVDYIYSLHDLESDIANLRLVLNEMKQSSKSEEFANLVKSTEDIYNLVESVKQELPTSSDFESLSEDIVSISSRTNKLLLASDESYKTLQDNLQEFKLVINDLDERTRNFAQESGMDKLEAKLNAINTMMQNGAKTNQVFNQVFEYLAEWVDNASVQINSISDRVESLDDIVQIKTMISDMKAQDDADSVELVEALGTVFDKQTKRISALDKKLDKIIVETTISNKKSDISPLEETLNKFLVAMDEKFSLQEEKISLLESKLEKVMDTLDTKETEQLTKKVGGMDRQIAKLNKSIEKIASHVIEN